MPRTYTGTQGRVDQRRNRLDPEDEESDEEFDAAQTQAQTQGRAGLSDNDLKSKAAQMVRLALFYEYGRKTIKRADLRAKCCPDNARGFNAIFEQAQRQLRSVFGMEMAELRGKQKGAEEGAQVGKKRASNANGDEGNATQASKKSASTGTYILRSVMPPALIASMSHPQPLPHLELAEDEMKQDEDDPDSGALIRWEKGDGGASGHVALMGIRTVILCLVLCLGRMVQDDQLHSYLRRLNLERNTVLPYAPPDTKEDLLTLDKYLDLLAKQNYLEKTRIPAPDGAEENATIEWRWGAREAEFSEVAAAQFIVDVFMRDESDDLESDEEEVEDADGRRRKRSRREKVAERDAKKAKLKSDIAKAAGSELTG